MAEFPTGFQRTARLQPRSDGPTVAIDTSADASSASLSASSIRMVVASDVGKVLAGRYEINSVIGEGGMGVVYEAWDRQVERKCAIKLVRSDTTADKKFLSRFRRELEITSQLRHPSTIRVFEHGETEDGRPYMVMELLTGESLADRMERGPLTELESLQIARQVAESLSEAHEHGVFHRDLKPDNIFIETVGVSKVVKVLDFGIAGGVDAARLTQAGEVFGTPQYMSPEQCNGLPLDHRTDIYSLGCILYEMLEGRPPFSAESPPATMLKHLRSRVPALRRASPETAKVVMMALRKDRNRRVQSAGRFAELIGRCMGGLRTGNEHPAPELSRVAPASPGVSGPAVSLGALSQNSLRLPPTAIAPRQDRQGLYIAFGLGLLAVLFGVLLAATNCNSGAPHAVATSPSVPASVTGTGDGYPFNRALVSTNVEGAQVLVDGQVQCEAPCQIKVPVGDDRSHEIRLVKSGYIDIVQVWQPASVSAPLPALPDMQPLSDAQ